VTFYEFITINKASIGVWYEYKDHGDLIWQLCCGKGCRKKNNSAATTGGNRVFVISQAAFLLVHYGSSVTGQPLIIPAAGVMAVYLFSAGYSK